ncbi:hypothetical protein BH09BAC6_BH09BAC6_22920 [soil metagenome]
MAFKFLKQKWQKVVAIILLSITALILLLALFINQYWSPILADKVKSVVATSSDGLYKADFSSAELHVLQGKIVIYNITLKPDTAIYRLKKSAHLAPNNLVELQVKKLVLTHIHPFRLYFKHKLDIGEIILSQPELKVSYQLNHTKDTVTKDHRTAWQKISKSLRSIHVGSILLSDVKFKYEDYSGIKLAVSELKEMNLSARDLLIDSATQADKTRLLYCRDILAELNNYKGKTASGLYSYAIRSVKLSTLKSQLNIEGLTVQPVKPGVFFGKSQADRFTLRLDSIQVNNFDFLNYHKYRLFTASSLVLNKGTIGIFTNPNRKPDNKTDKVITFPNVLIHTLNTALQIDTILVRQLNVVYSEYSVKSNQTGILTFNNTSGDIFNVTTKKDELLKNHISSTKLTTYFMNRGKLDVSFTFNLTDKDNSYSYKGHLGAMDLRVINQATMPLAMLKIKSGTVKRFDFDIQGNRYVTKGRVDFLYNKVDVNLLKADTIQDKLKKMTIASLFANVFILKHDNPDKAGDAPRSFFVTYQRPVTSPFFKTIWKTLLTGIKPIAGLDAKTQQATADRIKEHDTNKEKRKIKKAARKLRRAERKKKKEAKKLG